MNSGPIYPLELTHENCVSDTRVCHCHDKFILFGKAAIYPGLGDKEIDFRTGSREYWGEFIRTGTFPNGHLGEMKTITELNG